MDNIIVAFEMQHFLKRKTQGMTCYVAFKIDMSKAYNRVGWSLLRAIMLKLGFAEKWVNLVLHCITTVECFVLNQGEEIFLSILKGSSSG